MKLASLAHRGPRATALSPLQQRIYNVLLSQPGCINTDRLAELIWPGPDGGPRTSRMVLSTTIRNMRRQKGVAVYSKLGRGGGYSAWPISTPRHARLREALVRRKQLSYEHCLVIAGSRSLGALRVAMTQLRQDGLCIRAVDGQYVLESCAAQPSSTPASHTSPGPVPRHQFREAAFSAPPAS
jgi:hypothetical protein